MSSSTRGFARHYAEMVVAMFAGMAVLGLPAGWALEAGGSSWSALNDDAPALMLLAMAAIMTAPMVAWMRHRGHGRRANLEMSAAMFAPAIAVIPFLQIADLGRLMVVEHAGMLLAMVAAMLLRPDEYAAHAHGRRQEVTA